MKKKSIAKNYIYNLLYQLLTIVTPLITTPYVCRVLGVNNNGIYGYTLSIVTYFILFGSLGTNMYGQREIAYVQDDKKKQTKIFWEIMLIKVISYLFASLAFVLFLCISGEYALYYRILCVALLANLIDISWFFQGNEDFEKTVIRNMIVKVLGLILVFLLVKTKNDLWIYFTIYVLSEFLGNLSLWLYLPKYLDKNSGKKKLKKHLKPIMALFIPQIAIQIYAVLDKTMVGNITGDMAEVAYYDQAQRVIRALLLIVSAMSTVMCSRIAYAYSKHKYKDMKKYLNQSVHMVWLLATPFILGTFAISKHLVPIYFGAGFEPVVGLMNVTSIILLSIGLNNITGIQYLIQTKQQKIFTKSVTIAAIINVILNYFFIKMYGAIGAAYSSIIAETFILIYHLRYTKEYLTLKDIILASYKYIISSIVMYIVIMLLSQKLDMGIISLGIKVIVGAISYLATLFILKDKFTFDLCNQVTSFIKKKIKR